MRLGIVLLLLAGCATFEPPTKVEKVPVPVPVPCVVDIPASPAAASRSELLKFDQYQRTLRVWTDRQRLEDHAAELRAILLACQTKKAPD